MSTEPNYAEIEKEAKGVLELDSKNKVALKFIAMCDRIKELEDNLQASEDNAGELQLCFDELMPENKRLKDKLYFISIMMANPENMVLAKKVATKALKQKGNSDGRT